MVTNNSIYWFVFMTWFYKKKGPRKSSPSTFEPRRADTSTTKELTTTTTTTTTITTTATTTTAPTPATTTEAQLKGMFQVDSSVFFRDINCEFCLSRILPYFPMLVSVLVTGAVTSQDFSIIWFLRPYKPYTLTNLITRTALTIQATLEGYPPSTFF